MPRDLSTNAPDFDSLVVQLIAELEKKAAWRDTVQSGAGRTLIEFMAGIGTMLHFNLEQQIKEVFIDTASTDTAVYLNALMLGVKIKRKQPARVTCNLTSVNGTTINNLDGFTIDGDRNFYYTGEPIVLTAGVELSGVVLYEGIPATAELSREPSGSAFRFDLGIPDFVVSETNPNVRVFSGGNEIFGGASGGIFTGDYTEITLPNGSVSFLFETAPSGNIFVSYTTNNGAAGNHPISGLSVTGADDISGTTTSVISGGVDQDSADDLRYLAPRLSASNQRAVRRNDYEAIALNITSDVLDGGETFVDAKAYGEFEIGEGPPPNIDRANRAIEIVNNKNMNRAELVMLKAGTVNKVIDSVDEDELTTYFNAFKPLNILLNIKHPTPKLLNLKLDVVFDENVNKNSKEQEIKDTITNFYAEERGVIGRAYNQSDVIRIVGNLDGVVSVITSDATDINYIGSPIAAEGLGKIDSTFSGITYDSVNNRFLVVDRGGQIIPVSLSGEVGNPFSIELPNNVELEGVAFDPTNTGKILLLDNTNNKITPVGLDSVVEDDIAISTSSVYTGIAVDAVNGKIFVSDFTTNKIISMNLDGTGQEDFATGLPGNLQGLTFDSINERILAVDNAGNNIIPVGLDGTTEGGVISLENENYTGIVSFNYAAYLLDDTNNQIIPVFTIDDVGDVKLNRDEYIILNPNIEINSSVIDRIN